MNKALAPQPTTFLTVTPAMRKLLEAAVEDAMNFAESITLFLDELDGDPDREPALGEPEQHPRGWAYSRQTYSHAPQWTDAGTADEREDGEDPPEDDDPLEANGDEREPSLGSLCGTRLTDHLPQTMWAAGDNSDLEDGYDGREPEDHA